jgi:hypothetical protein
LGSKRGWGFGGSIAGIGSGRGGRTGGAYSSALMTCGGRDCQRIDQISRATNAACTRIARSSASLAPGVRPA